MSERKNFRRRYMYVMNVHAPGSKRIAVRVLSPLSAIHVGCGWLFTVGVFRAGLIAQHASPAVLEEFVACMRWRTVSIGPNAGVPANKLHHVPCFLCGTSARAAPILIDWHVHSQQKAQIHAAAPQRTALPGSLHRAALRRGFAAAQQYRGS